MWSWSSTCAFSLSGKMMCLPFIMTPSIAAKLSLNDQYALISLCIWSLLSGHPTVMYPFSYCKCSSCAVACHICWLDMHSGTFLDVCIGPTLTSMPCIASSLFSMWFCWDSQSGMNIWLVQYSYLVLMYPEEDVLNLLWRVTTSFLNIATRVLWSIIIPTSLAKQ